MAYDAANGTVVLFGGYNGGQLGDTWTWNGSTWTQQSPAHSPAARSSSVMAYDAATQTVVLFSGSGGTNPNDTWTWNGTDWTQQAPAHSPPYRYGAAMAYNAANGTIVLVRRHHRIAQKRYLDLGRHRLDPADTNHQPQCAALFAHGL